MNLFLTLAFLFCIGSVLGWGLEVIFRRFFSAHHWVNPGFLVGPYLPLYGSSLCVLYLLAMLEPLMPGDSPWLKKILLFVVMALAITALEYVAGMIFIHGMKIKLWDYSDRWGNVKGIICPLFTFFWLVLSAVYYFLIHTQDDELARLCLFGHHGCLDLIEDHSGLERFFLDDTVHTSRLLHFVFCGGTAAVGFRSFYCIIPQRNRQLSDILNPGNKWKKPPPYPCMAAVSCIIWSRAANT